MIPVNSETNVVTYVKVSPSMPLLLSHLLTNQNDALIIFNDLLIENAGEQVLRCNLFVFVCIL